MVRCYPRGMSKSAYTIVIPGLFDTPQRIDAQRAPALSRWLRQSRSEAAASSVYPQVLDLFGYAQKLYDVAQLRAVADGLDPDAHWICADPLHLGVDVAHVYALGSGYMDLTQDEVNDSVSSINLHFDGAIELVAPHPLRWYLRTESRWQMDYHYPAEILAKTILDKLPRGADAASAKQVFNEIQMLLYAHPINQRRRAANQPTLDALWIWGTGEPLVRLPECAWDYVMSDDPIVQGLATLNGVRLTDVLPESGKLLIVDTRFKDCDAVERAYQQMPQEWLVSLKTLYPGNQTRYERKEWLKRLWNQ